MFVQLTVIARPDQYVGITTWKGDDQASHVINDLNFNGVPDFVWIKRRDGGAAPHQLYDTVRGETKPFNHPQLLRKTLKHQD